MHNKVLLAAAFLCLFVCGTTRAEDGLSDSVQAQVGVPLVEIGTGTYRKFGFSVYRATFWAAGGAFDPQKPYALSLRYTRDVSKDTLVDTVADDLHDQNVADDETLAQWRGMLDRILPDVNEGDTIVSLYLPGKKSLFFYNGKIIARIADRTFVNAFFNIWLGPDADEDLRDKLLGRQ